MAISSELTLAAEGGPLAASVSLPDGGLIGGLVPLHSSDSPSRHHFLLEHLAATLPPDGIAVLSFDRRPAPAGQDVPLAAQAHDARLAMRELRGLTGLPDLPVGVWGFSQGAWAAALAAQESDAAFLVAVSGAGISPAEQMRYGTAEQLRRAGYGPEAVRAMSALRESFECYLRGEIALQKADELLRPAVEEPWFELAWIPRELPPPGSWVDMDFDAEAAIGNVRCPMLAFFGDDDEWVPVEQSIQGWRAASEQSGSRLEVIPAARDRPPPHARRAPRHGSSQPKLRTHPPPLAHRTAG